MVQGNRSAEVLDKVRLLRSELGHRPLDSKSRVWYSSLLLGLTRSLEETRAAAFHARIAAELAPVTFPVVELAALVLARTGDGEDAAALVRQAFEYDPTAAADLLLKLEADLGTSATGRALADRPGAWVAWGRALFDAGRPEESQAVLVEAASRWKDDLELLVILSRRAASSRDWDSLARWTTRVDPLPTEGHGLELLAYRALLHAERADAEQANADLGSVLSVADIAPHVLVVAGDAQQRLGSIEPARSSWNRALFRIPADRVFERVDVLVRLANLEESDGRASVALRHWRTVLELDPNHAEARTRIRAMTGGS